MKKLKFLLLLLGLPLRCVHANVSSIRNTRFETGDFLYTISQTPQSAIRLRAVDGINISNNTLIIT